MRRSWVTVLLFVAGCKAREHARPSLIAEGSPCETGDACPCFACTCEKGSKGFVRACVEGKCQGGKAACDDVCADRDDKVMTFGPSAHGCDANPKRAP